MVYGEDTSFTGFFNTERSCEEIVEFNKSLIRALINLRKLEDLYFSEYVNSNKKITEKGE